MSSTEVHFPMKNVRGDLHILSVFFSASRIYQRKDIAFQIESVTSRLLMIIA